MGDRDIYAEAGHVSCAEAREIEKRFRASHFHNARDMGEHARFSIPVNPRRDDDIRLEAFIRRVERMEAELEAFAALRNHRGLPRAIAALEQARFYNVDEAERDACTRAIQLLRGASRPEGGGGSDV